MFFVCFALTDASRNAKQNKIIRRNKKAKNKEQTTAESKEAPPMYRNIIMQTKKKKRSSGKSIQLEDNLIKHNYLHLFLLLIKWLIIDDNTILYSMFRNELMQFAHSKKH